jgi:aldose 1-epimerase
MVIAAPFGALPDGRPVEQYTLESPSGMEVTFLALGGIIRNLTVPDRHGRLADVTPGYETVQQYLADTQFHGALIGRYANRIAGGRFVLDGREYRISRNDGGNHLHGGVTGFHRALWAVAPFTDARGSGAVLSLTSQAGDEGFPGTLDVRVTYLLTSDDELHFDYLATTDEPTPVNFTQHAYFNLGGHDTRDVLEHEITVHASRYLPVTADFIPSGELRSVQGTGFDLRRSRTLGDGIASLDGASPIGGYDHCFLLDEPRADSAVVARLCDPRSGRTLEIETTEPALQLYTGGQLGARRDEEGKRGVRYGPYSAVALETQHLPNSPNEPAFPTTILRPGESYRSHSVYRFGAEDPRRRS